MKLAAVCAGLALAGATVSAFAQSEPYLPDPDTAVLYHFDGPGEIVTDASGHAVDGQSIGSTWQAEGRFGGCLLMDGEARVELYSDSVSLDSSDLTYEAWIYRTDQSPGWIITSIGYGADPLGDGRGLFIDAGGHAGAIASRSHNETVYGPYTALGASVLPTQQWVHVAAVFDEGQRHVRIYVNGVLDGEGELEPGFAGSTTVTIGMSSRGGGFRGPIDELRISKTVRTFIPVPVEPTTWGSLKATWGR